MENGKAFEFLNKKFKDIDNKLQQIFNGLLTINNKADKILQCSINNFTRLNIPAQIELQPRQLYLAYKRGWTLNQLSGLTGFSESEIQKKIESYMKTNV